jgi:hypothetical protein
MRTRCANWGVGAAPCHTKGLGPLMSQLPTSCGTSCQKVLGASGSSVRLLGADPVIGVGEPATGQAKRRSLPRGVAWKTSTSSAPTSASSPARVNVAPDGSSR